MRKRLLLDSNLPQDLRNLITDHDVQTARFAGWHDLEDGALLDAMAGKFDVLLTGDANLPYQQRLIGRPIAVLVLRARRNRIEDLVPLLPKVLMELWTLQAGEVREVWAI